MTPAVAECRDRAAGMSSFGRLGVPADIVAFLAGDDARWLTGQRIGANGGSA